MTNSPILNIMFGRARGGIEQAALDYAEAMHMQGIACLTITQPHAAINTALDALKLPYITLRTRGIWDQWCAWKLHRLCRTHNARAIITHGNRALSMAQGAARFGNPHTHTPLIAVAHNYQLRRFGKIDAAFTITQHLASTIRAAHPHVPIFIVPNAVRITATPSNQRPWHTPPMIGSMGRFVAKKGFDVYIDALALLKQRGIAFSAVLGGEGEEGAALRAQAEKAGLNEHLYFCGWVKDKPGFWRGMDIFVLPSHHEPFGIVLIEAMAESLPVIATMSEGPREIIINGECGTLVSLNDAAALADALAATLADPMRTSQQGLAARTHVEKLYSLSALGKNLEHALSRYK